MKYKNLLFYTAVFLFVTALSYLCPYADYDLWARLLQGGFFLENGHVMIDDIYSYVKGHKFIDYEWGSGVIFFLILKYYGYSGLVFLKAVLMFLMFVFILRTVKINALKSLQSYSLVFFAAAALCFETILLSGLRCQCFTFMFFSLFLCILEEVRINNKNLLLCLLPVLMTVWCNLHGGCIAGAGLIFLYAAGEALNKKPFKKYLYALIGAACGMMVNPYGFSYITALFYSVTIPRNDIAEWQNIFETGHNMLIKSKIFIISAVIVMISSFYQRIKTKKNINYTKYLVLSVLLYLACSHIKHLPLFLAAVCALLYNDFFGFFNSFVSKIKSEKFCRIFSAAKEVFVYFLVIFSGLIIFYLNYSKDVTEKALSIYPVKTAEFMKINSLKGAVLNKLDIGSYLAYKLYPQNLIYMDGRYEALYYDYTVQENRAFFDNDKNFNAVFEREGFPSYIIVNLQDYIYPKLSRFAMYKEIFKDKYYALYARADIVKDKYIQPEEAEDYYIKTFFDRMQ